MPIWVGVGALLISAGSLFVAVLAFLTARRSLILHVDRDLREQQSKRPRAELDPETFDGTGPWDVKLTILNRDEVPIFIERIYEDTTDQVEFSRYDDSFTVMSERSDSSKRSYIQVNKKVRPQQEVEVHFGILPVNNQRIASQAVIVLPCRYRRSDVSSESKTIEFKISANP